MKPLQTKSDCDCEHVGDKVIHRVIAYCFEPRTCRIAALIDGDRAIAGFCERHCHFRPAVGELREAMKEKDSFPFFRPARQAREHHSASSQGEFLDIHPGCGLIADIRHCAEASAGCLFHPASAIHLSAERLGMNRYSPPFMTLKV